MPLPTNRVDGQTIRASHINSTNEKINELEDQFLNFPPGGLDAYEVAVGEGFVGTREEWVVSLKGDKGDKGEDGSGTVDTVVRARNTPTTAFKRDDFDRPNGPLGAGWVDGHDVMPTVYEPLGIYNGKVVCTDPRARAADAAYDTIPVVNHPPAGGLLHAGIGCAWLETGSRRASVKGRWSGIHSDPATAAHVEFAPLVHITPGSAYHGFGVWMSEYGGAVFLIVGAIANPPEDFTALVHGSAFISNTASGVTRDIELVTDGTDVRCYIDGSDVPVTWNRTALGGGGTSTTVAVPAQLKDSTLHGFAVDAHFTTYANIPTTPSAEWVEVKALDGSAARTRAGGTVLDGAGTQVEGAEDGTEWRHFEDSLGNTAYGMFANTTDTQPKLAFGMVFGTPYIFAGPGGSTAPTAVMSLTHLGLTNVIPQIFKPTGSTGVWRIRTDSGGNANLGMFANDSDTQPKLAFGMVFGTAYIFAGPGGSTTPSAIASLSTAGLVMSLPITGKVNPPVGTVAFAASPAVNVDLVGLFSITAQNQAITSMTTNLTGTPVNGQRLIYRIKDDGTARAITWGAKFASGGVALPTTTVINKVTRVELEYDTVPALWRTVSVLQEP